MCKFHDDWTKITRTRALTRNEYTQTKGTNKRYTRTNDDFWKIGFIREIIEVKNEQLGLNDFTKEELNHILAYLCTS